MAPKSKDADSAPTITTHHSMAAGGQPSAAHESPETTQAEPEAVLTRPKKLILQPMHTAAEVNEAPEEVSTAIPTAEKIEESGDNDAPLVLETAAETEAAAKLAAKLPEDKIELPLEDIVLEEVNEDELAESPKATERAEDTAQQDRAPSEATDPGEAAGATAEVDPNEARAQKAEALIASGKYTVHIHESSRSRGGLIVGVTVGVLVILAAVYFAAAENMLDVGVDLPKFW